ncbi:MAG: CehA/McbA family metallohydrolase, partial [Planctomycetaceae bacterium]
MQRIPPSVLRVALLAIAGTLALRTADAAKTVELTFRITGENGKPLPCRIHLTNAAGKPLRAPRLPFFRDHFVCPGTATLNLAPGSYTYEIERGPEYARKTGRLKVTKITGNAEVKLQLKRIDDLATQGWYGGDLHVHRPLKDIRLLMQAEDLYVAPVITWWNGRNAWNSRKPPGKTLVKFDGNRYYDVMAGEDEREGGALMYFGLKTPLQIAGSSREFPSPMKFVAAAKKRNPDVWIDVEKPFWWDVPVWLASGQVNSIGLANNHMCRSRMYESEAWGRPRDAKRLPPPRGNGHWTQEIYYHILNCGLRLPPSAGSASGVLPNPVGYNRVYVHTGKPFSYEKWWAGLKAGRSFVTNGPLLIGKANGRLPGSVFRRKSGELKIALTCRIRSNDAVPKIEIIKNGETVRSVPTKDVLRTGKLGTITFKSSGWFLIRAIADDARTFR